MAVFSNNAINRSYFHSAFRALAENAGGLFTLVFLLKFGVPAPLVFCSIAAITLGRYVLRPAVLPLARGIGLRNTLILGTVLEALGYLLTPFVRGLGPMLIAYIVVTAIGSVIYWTSYHAYISALGDTEHRGRQVGATHAVHAAVGVFAPVLGGFALVNAGAFVAFFGAALVQVLAAAPLLGAPNVAIAADAPLDRKAAELGRNLFFMDGWMAASTGMVWQIALFVTLGERFVAYGGAMALAGLLGAAMSFGLGRSIDLGHGQRALQIAYGGALLVVLVKAAGFSHPLAAVVANALGAVSSSMLMAAFLSPVYNLAKQSACPLRFHMSAERGWDLGCASGCLIAAAALSLGASYALPILMAAAGVGGAYVMLRGNYRALEGAGEGISAASRD